jgi:uncharacterized protein YndB with AHSA1/START domain/class 3 adenylate cyclase
MLRFAVPEERSMLAQPESACLLIGDISGYTGFLESVELDHAHDIIADLMSTVVKALRPPFRIAKFEGDAVFVLAPLGKLDGSQVQDVVEAAYIAFRRRLRAIRQATTCACEACRRMQDLDLKFVCHCGEVVRHKMAGREELAGRDVILVHRLLKNGAAGLVGGHAYALYSQACTEALAIDTTAQGLIEDAEVIDVIGPVTCWVRDLEQAWRDETDRRRHEVTREGAAYVLTFDFAAPRQVVWDHFVMPDLRPTWRAADEVREAAAAGRRGAGTTNHCMHGDRAIVEEVIEWRPFESVTLTTLLPAPKAPKIPMTYAFRDIDGGGTQVEIRIAAPKPKDRDFVDHAASHFTETITREVGVLKSMIETPAGPSTDEPPPPTSAGRHLGITGAGHGAR